MFTIDNLHYVRNAMRRKCQLTLQIQLLSLILVSGSVSTVYATSLLLVSDCSKLADSAVNTIFDLQNVANATLSKYPLMPSTRLILEGANGRTVPGT